MALFKFLKKLTKKNKAPSKAAKTTSKSAAKKPRLEELGVITHSFRKISVGIIKVKKPFKVGDKIQIKGMHADFKQTVKSMQYDHQDISLAKKGLEVGIKVAKPVHENDRVYRA